MSLNQNNYFKTEMRMAINLERSLSIIIHESYKAHLVIIFIVMMMILLSSVSLFPDRFSRFFLLIYSASIRLYNIYIYYKEENTRAMSTYNAQRNNPIYI